MSNIRPWTNGDQVALDAAGNVPVSVGDSTGAEWLLNNGGMPINLRDSAGNPISSTGTSLDTNITNEPSVNLQDGSGNDIGSSTAAGASLDVGLHDSVGTPIVADADGRIEISVGDSTGAEWLLNAGGMPINMRDSSGTSWDQDVNGGQPVNSKLYDDTGAPWLLESNGAMPVNIQDQHTEIIDLHMSILLSGLTLTAGAAIDDLTITGDVDAAFVPVVGNLVCLKEDTAFYQAEILVAVNNAGDNWTLTLDTPLDFAFTVAGGCSIRNQNMNVDGSITTQVFALSPANLTAGTEWDITRVIFNLEDDTTMDSSRFGGIASLTSGIVLRSENGITKNVFNVKTNGDFAAHSYDIAYDDRAPAGAFGLRVRSSFAGQAKRGVTIRLEADTADEIQVLVQDDLTDLTKFHCVVQGHVVGN